MMTPNRRVRAIAPLAGVAIIVGLAIPVMAELLEDQKCDPYGYIGCSPGEYECWPWTTYPCQGGGMSKSKKGFIFDFCLCVPDEGNTCDQQPKLCQRDVYYKNANCTVWCDEHSRDVKGCTVGGD